MTIKAFLKSLKEMTSASCEVIIMNGSVTVTEADLNSKFDEELLAKEVQGVSLMRTHTAKYEQENGIEPSYRVIISIAD